MLPADASEAPFLTPEDKDHVAYTLEEDGVLAMDAREDKFAWEQVIETIKKPHVLLVAVIGFFNGAHITAFSNKAFADGALARIGTCLSGLAVCVSSNPTSCSGDG